MSSSTKTMIRKPLRNFLGSIPDHAVESEADLVHKMSQKKKSCINSAELQLSE